MLKWYLRIYIFIEYLKYVWKSNCIWIIRNDSKKKKSEDHVPESGFSLSVGSGIAAWDVTLVVNAPFISKFQWYNINNYDIQNIEVWSFR